MNSVKNYYLNRKHDSLASRLMEVILFLYSGLTSLHLEYCIQLWGPNKEVDLLEEQVQRGIEGWSTSL